MARIPVIREEDDELLGFIEHEAAVWTAQTIFGYVFARVANQNAAEAIVRERGLSVLDGVWQYFDKSDKAWYPCRLKEVYELRVVVIRTNEMGYEDPDTYKHVTIIGPNDTNLVKS